MLVFGAGTIGLLTIAAIRQFTPPKRLIAVAFENETDPALADMVDEIVWVKVGQLSKMINTFSERGVRQCIMAGQIAPRNLFDVRPDLRAVGVLLRLKERNAHSIFGAIAAELALVGVEGVMSRRSLLALSECRRTGVLSGSLGLADGGGVSASASAASVCPRPRAASTSRSCPSTAYVTGIGASCRRGLA